MLTPNMKHPYNSYGIINGLMIDRYDFLALVEDSKDAVLSEDGKWITYKSLGIDIYADNASVVRYNDTIYRLEGLDCVTFNGEDIILHNLLPLVIDSPAKANGPVEQRYFMDPALRFPYLGHFNDFTKQDVRFNLSDYDLVPLADVDNVLDYCHIIIAMGDDLVVKHRNYYPEPCTEDLVQVGSINVPGRLYPYIQIGLCCYNTNEPNTVIALPYRDKTNNKKLAPVTHMMLCHDLPCPSINSYVTEVGITLPLYCHLFLRLKGSNLINTINKVLNEIK